MINKTTLLGDTFGGLTAGVVALPLALAFGVQSGMGAVSGLYGAIALGLLAAIFGGTKTQISGPTGPMAVVVAVIIAEEVTRYGSIEDAFATIIATFVLAGIFQVIMGISKVAQYIRYMPYPVVSGFMSGIGVIIIVLQIFPFFGLSSPSKVTAVFSSLNSISSTFNSQAIILSSVTIATIYIFPYFTKRLPSTLVALIGVSFIAIFMNLDVPIIGDIPKGLPDIHINTLLGIDWRHPMVIIIPALTLASLGAIDSLLTSVVADNMTKTQHQSSKELIGQGVGNIAAGIIGGLPGAGATMRTVVNIKAGGKSRLSGIIHGLFLLIVLFGAGKYTGLIPLPVLAGILITVGIGIIDYRGLKHIFIVPRSEAIIKIIVLLLTIFVNLLQAVAVGIVLASILFMKKMSDIAKSNAYTSALDEHTSDEKILCQNAKNQIYIQHFNGPIFFGFTAHFNSMMVKLPKVKIVILRMEEVPYIDQTGMYAIEDAVLQLKQKDISVIIVGIKEQPLSMLKGIRLISELVSSEYLFKNFKDARKFALKQCCR